MAKKTKDRILVSALKLIDKSPYPQVSTKEIAKDVGVSEGAIFRHYSSKDEILEYLCENFLNKITQIDMSKVEDEKSFKRELILFFMELQNTKSSIYKLALYVSMYKKNQFKVFNEIITRKVYAQIESVVKQGMKKWNYNTNINIKLSVRLLMYSIYFFIIQQNVFEASKIEKFNMKEVVETSVDNFILSLKS